MTSSNRLLFPILLLAPALPAWSAIDALEVARSQATTDRKGAAVRWLNVKNTAFLVGGRASVPQLGKSAHAIDLDRQAARILLPGLASLRIVPGKDAQPNPSAQVSNGTGVSIETGFEPIGSGPDRVLSNMQFHPVVVYLEKPAGWKGSFPITAYISRPESVSGTVAYRDEISLPLPDVNIRSAEQASSFRYGQLESGKAIDIAVEGPRRLRLEFRSRLPDARRQDVIGLQLKLDGSPLAYVRQPTDEETTAPVQINGRWAQAGRAERAYVDIPPGSHTLSLESSHTVLIRATATRGDDMLLPGLNIPDEWGSPDLDAAAGILSETEQQAAAAALSNEARDIGKLAADSMKDRTDHSTPAEMLQSAARLSGQASFYRSILPGSSQLTQRVNTSAFSYFLQTPVNPAAPAAHQLDEPSKPYHVQRPATGIFTKLTDIPVKYRLPDALHRLTLRAVVSQPDMRSTVVIAFDNGVKRILRTGSPMLDSTGLTPLGRIASVEGREPIVPVDSGIDNRNDIHAPLTAAGAVELAVPEEARSFTAHAADGSPIVTFQWQASAAFVPGDAATAAMARSASDMGAAASLVAPAAILLQRRLSDAKREFSANVGSISSLFGKVDASATERWMKAARTADDPVRRVELWSEALRSANRLQAAEALTGLATSLLAAGERFQAERLLRAAWLSDSVELAQSAYSQLASLYERENDAEMLLLMDAAQAARNSSHLARLAMRYAHSGDDEMALLAGLMSSERDLETMLQAALRTRRWQTFDTLLEQLGDSSCRTFWQGQKALSAGSIREAQQYFDQAGSVAWSKTVADAERVARDMRHGHKQDMPALVRNWLDWQRSHPGAHLWRSEPGMIASSGGGATLRSVALDARSDWWLTQASRPLVVRAVGPARIQVTARPLHSVEGQPLSGWLNIQSSGQRWLHPFWDNQPSPGIVLDNGVLRPGSSVSRVIELPPGLHELAIHTGAVESVARVLISRPALQVPSLPAPMAQHFSPAAVSVVHAEPLADCSANNPCTLSLEERLRPARVAVIPGRVIHLPVPDPVADPVARLVSQEKWSEALALEGNPLDKMRIIARMVESNPSLYPAVMPDAASLAKGYPEAEVQRIWSRVSQGSRWERMEIVERSAGIRSRELPYGASDSPSGRIRSALLGAAGPDEVRLTGDINASLGLDLASTTRITASLVAETSPGAAVLPVTIEILHNDKSVRKLTLSSDREASAKVGIPLPAGPQRLSVRLVEPHATQSVRLRFSGMPGSLPARTQDWHIATPAEPVRVAVPGKAWLRIDRLDKTGVVTEDRFTSEGTRTLDLRATPGSQETLYRIYIRNSGAQAPIPPRPVPNQYRPEPVPQPGPKWLPAPLPEPTTAMAKESLPLKMDSAGTWSGRVSAQKWRDTEATGGNEVARQERYGEVAVGYRQRSVDGLDGYSGEILVRDPDQGAGVLGFSMSRNWLKPWSARAPWPLELSASVTGYLQHTPYGTGAALTGTAAIEQTRSLSLRLSHTPGASVTVRAMNLNDLPETVQVDTDVYTSYRDNHPFALALYDTVSWRPYRDVHLGSRFRLVSNPNLNLFKPDYYRAEPFVRLFAAGVTLEMSGRLTRYLEDSDRSRSITRKEMRFGAGWDYWMNDGSRLDVRGVVLYDTDRKTTWGGVELRWFLEKGLPFDSFGPNEVDFRDLRSWRVPRDHLSGDAHD